MANARQERIEELAALGRLMADPAGRRWLYDLLSFCHVYVTSFERNALGMAYSEGERNVGLRLTADALEANQDAYLMMLKEKASERPRKPESESDDSDADTSA